MATKTKATDTIGKVKFRVIEFELEGTAADMQETIRGFTAALNRGDTIPAARRLRASSPAREIEDAGDEVQFEEPEEAIDAEVVEPDRVKPARRPSSPKKIRSLKVLTDIRMDDVSPTLKEFANLKAPDSHNAKYRVIAYWFKNHKSTPDLTVDHFFTAYRYLGWSTPTDPAKPMENLRGTAIGHFSAGATRGTSTINHIGERHVLEMSKAD